MSGILGMSEILEMPGILMDARDSYGCQGFLWMPGMPGLPGILGGYGDCFQ